MSHPLDDLDMLEAICAQVAKLSGTAVPPERVHIRVGEVDVALEWPSATAGPDTLSPISLTTSQPAVEEPDVARYVRAPLIGTFYRAPAPDAPPFVREGDVVRAGQQVGIVEAMKLMNPVRALESGTVREVMVSDGEPVEYDQPLIALTDESTDSTDDSTVERP